MYTIKNLHFYQQLFLHNFASGKRQTIMKEAISHFENKLKFETDSWDVNQAIEENSNMIVIDARSKEAYENEHIPQAINLHHQIMDEKSTAHLDKGFLYVTYCDGIGCNASTKGAIKMTKLGFRTKELMGGIDWWKRDGYHTEGKNGIAAVDISCNCE